MNKKNDAPKNKFVFWSIFKFLLERIMRTILDNIVDKQRKEEDAK